MAGADKQVVVEVDARELSDGKPWVRLQLTEVVDQLLIPVLCFGLRTDFRGELFPGSQYLLAWADELEELKTICHTGRKATMVVRVDEQGRAVKDGPQVEIGGNERYVSVSRAEFQKIILFLLEKGADLNPVTKTRKQNEGAGFVVIAGQSPLGIVEGTFNGGTYNERPETAAFLRKLGAKSIGRATLQSYVQQSAGQQGGAEKDGAHCVVGMDGRRSTRSHLLPYRSRNTTTLPYSSCRGASVKVTPRDLKRS